MIVGKLWRACGADQQAGQLILDCRSDRPDAVRVRLGRRAAQGGPRGAGAVPALVERVSRQVAANQKHVTILEAKVKGYLQAGDRETAAKFALELQKAKQELAENQTQLKMHEEAYNNNVTKIKHASKKLGKVREKIAQVRCRAEDEPGRSRNGQAGRRASIST